MRPFLIALQFLSILPLPLRRAPTDDELGRSVLFYPLVGLVLGSLLYAGAAVSAGWPLELRAALLLTLWVALTGALHLDGLADCADAWVAGRGDREKTLAVMKDPRAGPMAVVALLLALLLKFTALLALLRQQQAALLLATPLLGRSALLLLLLSVPYVRPQGLGSALARQLPRTPAMLVLALCALALLLWPQLHATRMLLAALLTTLLLRALMLQRIGGATGDTLGATLELVEITVLGCAVL